MELQSRKVDGLKELLVIDDDKLLHKLISKLVEGSGINIRYAFDGLEGIKMAESLVPDIILLDVEMPSIDGYETCKRLRQIDSTKDVPILFLSAHASLKERMFGYEAGGDDFLAKPFENDILFARINVLLKYHKECQNLREQYLTAQATAVTALTGLGELGMATQFLERSISYNDIESLVEGMFQNAAQFQLDCCLMVQSKQGNSWFASSESVSPIEKELFEMADRKTRFLDFGEKTMVNYPAVSVLVRNMPLDDMEKYGRIKDILPVLVSAVNVKMGTFEVQDSLNIQNEQMLETFKNIRRYLFHMGKGVVQNRSDGQKMTDDLIQSLHADLLRMGLEQDQEDFLLDRIDSVSNEIIEKLNAGVEIRDVLSYILTNLKNLITKQELMIDDLTFTLSEQCEAVEEDTGVDLF